MAPKYSAINHPPDNDNERHQSHHHIDLPALLNEAAETAHTIAKYAWLYKLLRFANEYTPLLDRHGIPDRHAIKRLLTRVVSCCCFLFILIIVIVSLVVYFFVHRGNDAPHKQPLTDPEKLVIEIPSSSFVKDFLHTYTAEPHLAGTDADRRYAEWTRDKMVEFGIEDTTIQSYYPLLTSPVQQRLAIVSGPPEFIYEAKLKEDPIPEDTTSSHPNITSTFHAYSKNGTATGRVVYANYGSRQDFEYLLRRGVELRGTIALMRSGGGVAAGIKVQGAERHGCVGALIYTDPADDGAVDKQGYPYTHPDKEYPDGPWRSANSVRRDSVEYISMMAGDPSTPGWGATTEQGGNGKEQQQRLDRDSSPCMSKIPSLPISYGDALPLLRATQNIGVCDGEGWQGGLAQVVYCSGPSVGEAELINHVEDKVTPIWNVIGRIPGEQEPDHAVILGTHRDAWVFGAADASSGSATMLELARTLGILLSKGWRPRRTIILASWDAHEYGMVGSTEWVEDNQDWLTEQAVGYLNVGGVAGQYFAASAAPSFHQLLYQVTSSIVTPGTEGTKTVYETWSEYTNSTEVESKPLPTIHNLGAGADATAFFHHAGITSVDLGMVGDYGVAHSAYDSFHWMEKFGDPTFEYHATFVKICGLLTVRLSDDRLLPMYPQDYSFAIRQYMDDLPLYETNGMLLGSIYKPLFKSVKKLKKKTRRFERRRARLDERLKEFDNNVKDAELPSVIAKRLAKTNKRIMYFERGFIQDDENNEMGRPWFKHVIYAPSLDQGVSATTLPAMTEALAESNNGDTEEGLVHAIQRTSRGLYAAIEALKTDYDDDDDDDIDDDDNDD